MVINYKLVYDRLKCTSLWGLVTIRIGIDLLHIINFYYATRFRKNGFISFLMIIPIIGPFIFWIILSRTKIRKFKSYKLLQGYRGSKKYSLEKLCETASKLSFLAFDFRENLKEIDLNPVIILENDAIAVDNVFILS